MAPSNISLMARTSIPIDLTWKSRVRMFSLLSKPTPLVLLLAQHLLPLASVSLPAWASKVLPLANLPLANLQPRHLHSARPLLSVNPHNQASVRPLLSVAEVRRSGNPRTQRKTPRSASHLRWVVAPQRSGSPLLLEWVAVHQRSDSLLLLDRVVVHQHSGSLLLQARVLDLASLPRWEQNLLSDSQLLDSLLSQLSDRPQSPPLVKLVQPVLVRSQQRHQSQVASHKLHNNPRQASANHRHSAPPQASPVHSLQQGRLSNSSSSSSLRSQLHQTATPPQHQIHSVVLHNRPSASPPSQLPRIPSAQEQQQATPQNPPSANQPNPQPAPSASLHSQPQQETPSAKRNHPSNNNSNNNQTALRTHHHQHQQAQPPPPAPTLPPT